MSGPPPEYITRIAKIGEELGIRADYAAQRQLPLQLEAVELNSIGLDDAGRDCLLTPAAGAAWQNMRTRALAYGIELVPLSGFRSVDRQTEIIRGKLALGESIDEILKSIAAPGYSEHHSGRAIDIGARDALPLEEVFATTPAYAWLSRHGAHFGFRMSYPRNNRHGFVYEPWHWCWQG